MLDFATSAVDILAIYNQYVIETFRTPVNTNTNI